MPRHTDPVRAVPHRWGSGCRPARPRNDPAQYDDLADEWWRPGGAFAALHWLAAARARSIPAAPDGGAVLVDVACGGGLLAPHLPAGYLHVGVDLSPTATAVARAHGVPVVVRGDVHRLPFAGGIADVVVAGEIFEHVADLPRAVAECCRVLRPGGLLVVDTIARTWLARLLLVTVAERVPGVAPRGIHDPRLFVDRRALVGECARNGVRLRLYGLRPRFVDLVRWLARRRREVRMVRTRPTAVLFQGVGVKDTAARKRAVGAVGGRP